MVDLPRATVLHGRVSSDGDAVGVDPIRLAEIFYCMFICIYNTGSFRNCLSVGVVPYGGGEIKIFLSPLLVLGAESGCQLKRPAIDPISYPVWGGIEVREKEEELNSHCFTIRLRDVLLEDLRDESNVDS